MRVDILNYKYLLQKMFLIHSWKYYNLFEMRRFLTNYCNEIEACYKNETTINTSLNIIYLIKVVSNQYGFEPT